MNCIDQDRQIENADDLVDPPRARSPDPNLVKYSNAPFAKVSGLTPWWVKNRPDSLNADRSGTRSGSMVPGPQSPAAATSAQISRVWAATGC